MLPSPPSPALSDIALFLDFDGTLVEIAPTPDAVMVADDLRELLDRLAAAAPGRVAVVSGRSIAQLDAFLGSGLTFAGSHGAEIRSPGLAGVTPKRPPELEYAAAELSAYADLNGLVFEAKSFGAALHYRLKPQCEKDAVAMAERVAATHGLTLQRGKMVAEVRLPGDKGAAIEALMMAEAMQGALPWFIGDDVTDEDGFAAASALGGAGVLVGPERDSAATYRLPGVAALHDWLAGLLSRPRTSVR